jgi:hypothetical protein
MQRMFKPVDPNQHQRMIDLFKNFCEEFGMNNIESLCKCYENRLLYKCKYSPEIENIMNSIHKLIMKREGPEDWVSLLD